MMMLLLSFLLLVAQPSEAFTALQPPSTQQQRSSPSLALSVDDNNDWIRNGVIAATILVSTAVMTPAAWGDEYGREVEAPTLATGETVEVSGIAGVFVTD
jgi:hypothetical protein